MTRTLTRPSATLSRKRERAIRTGSPSPSGREWREEPGEGRVLLSLLFLAPALLLHCRQDDMRAGSDPPPIEIRATVHPAQSMSISAQIEGQVESVAVREGAPVEAGGSIAELSNPAVERDAAAARAQLAWIDTRMRRSGRPAATTSGRPRDTLEITARILEVKRQRFEKMKQLRRTSDITARELEQAEVEYLAALRDYNNERRVFAVGPAVVTDDPELLRIERQKVAAEEKFAVHRQSLLRVTSPIAGVVTRIQVAPGQNVFLRDPIAEVSNLSTLQVRGNVAPELLRYVRPGTRVDVKVFTIPVRTFADEIDAVIPVQGAGSESRAATVVVSIPNPDGSLQPNTEALITLRSLR
jgi:multidrug resistance efflux pump